MIPFEIDQNSLEALQGLTLDANSLTELKERPWLGAKSG